MRGVNYVLSVLMMSAPLIHAQATRCSYMLAIPRPPRPDDLPDIDTSGDWSQRPFLPAPDRQDLCMDVYESSSSTTGSQVIFLEEEIQDALPIARINYDGPETPYIVTPLMFGSFNLLGPEIRRVDDRWYLYINNRQDFESPGMQQYAFQVRIDGEPFTGIVSLRIVNIDDNDPIIMVLDPSSCRVPELGEPRLTNCIYEVHDADGQISTSEMTFEITSDRNDDKIFKMHGSTRPDTWFIMDMTVGLQQALDFMSSSLHIFQVTAYDSAYNSHTVSLMVVVENVEHRLPQWMEIFAVQRFPEKTEQTFYVRAVDGDPGINKPIYYRLETAPEDTFFSIETLNDGEGGGRLKVAPINRDALQRNLFQFKIIAYKPNNSSLATEADVVMNVIDVNDNSPEPFHNEYTVNIMEETALSLEFDEEFGFHDIDEGVNAQYEVHIEGISPPGVEKAFYIAPNVGYQRQTFFMGTINHGLLDYDDILVDYKNIKLRVVATDLGRPDKPGVAIVNVNLINWNDEDPIFKESNQVISFKETEGSGFFITRALAEDRDIGDIVVHSLMGNVEHFLSINKDTGDIYVSADNAFDYHRQNQIIVQIRAEDTFMTPYRTTTSQLTIILEDVNNTPPTLRLPRDNPHVEENVPEGYEISNKEKHIITAFDPDTTANLQFEIDWGTSYATKQGRQTDPREFRECVEIRTEYDSADNKGSATAILSVKELRTGVTIDFEMFEVLYVTIRVRDLNTVDGYTPYDESTLTITIIDMNDNEPEFVEGSLTQQLRVRERSATDTIIGSVTAVDIDGPLYNQVRYTIFPISDTPADLVKIDFTTGQIRVNLNEAIDADIPPRDNLYYKVVATDRCFTEPADCPPDPTFFETEDQLTIEIIDTNNKIPEPDTTKYDTTVYIYENAEPGQEVVLLFAKDQDRDDIYHTVSYQINYAINPRLRDFFAVDRDTGRVFVEYLNDEVLDRDGNESTHRIFLQLFDNFNTLGDGNRNQVDTEVLVVLLDINDNAPELPSPDQLTWTISEGLIAGTRLEPLIFARDIDEPGTDNSRVGYDILNLVVVNRDIEVPDLLTIHTIPGPEGEQGELETVQDLKGFWGTYDIIIHAFDHGVPQQDSQETYRLVINPYNFYAPEFVFPTQGTLVRLAREWAIVGIILRKVNDENLESITATDKDGLEAGVVTFSIVGNAVAEEYFNVVNNDNNMGTLQLRREITEQTEFDVTIRATDGGTDPGPQYTDTILRVVFVPTTGNPVFTTESHTVSFIEKEAGLSERLPKATDPKNYLCSDDCHNVYYSIFDGNDNGHFKLDGTTNMLSLVKELDREQSASHTLTVVTSNSPDFAAPVSGAVLVVIVNVRETDPRPVFEQNLYTAGITTADSVNRELLTVHATHSENAAITYTIKEDSMVVDPTLEAVKDSAFTLNPETGVLLLSIQPTAAMQGIFEFKVIATDPASKTDTTEVKIYLVSAQNWVYFVFLNTVAQVEANRNFIQQTFSAAFGMTCNIDQVTPFTDSSGIASETRTRLRTHFILDDVPVTADIVEPIRSDTERILAVRDMLLSRQVILQDVFTEESPEMTTNNNQMMVYVLAGMAALLGVMLVLLLVMYIIRTRTLNRRLEALSTNKYGSIDSGLNRTGLIAPGTNKHAVEGSNPIWNEAIRAPDFDALSVHYCRGWEVRDCRTSRVFKAERQRSLDNKYESGNPIPAEQSSSSDQQIPNHGNNFGFGTAPFRSQFANETMFSNSMEQESSAARSASSRHCCRACQPKKL